MRKIFLFASIILSLSVAAQNKIVITNNALNRVDSNIYVPHYQLDTAKVNLRTSISLKLNITDTVAKWVGSVYKRNDSLFYKIGTTEYVVGTMGGSALSTLTISSPLTGTSYNGSAPVSIGITNAAADGSTKGAASFNATYFDASSGNISPDLTNGLATSSQSGYATTNQVTSNIGVGLDGQGGVITTGSKGFVTIPFSCTITNWYVAADVSGTIQFDVKRSGTSIVGGGGNKPALSSAISGNAAVSGWTSTSVSAGDILEWVVDTSPAPASLTNVSLVLKVIK